MLQDKYLPNPDVSKVENLDIQAPVGSVFPVVADLNFRDSRVIYWLFRLRGLPVPESLSLKGLEELRFVKLEAVQDREIILGLIGKFIHWSITEVPA